MDEGEGGGGQASGEQDDHAAGDRLDQELQAIIEGTAGEARFREPTAAERGRLAKEAQKKREADARRTEKLREEARKQARKLQKENGKARHRRRPKLRVLAWTIWGVALAVLVGGGVAAYTGFHPSAPANSTPSLPATALSPVTASGPPLDPFQGTPADKWASGAAGITIPAAKPVGRYSASQVEAAYQTTKKLLIAAALDKQTLNGGAPTAFADLLGTRQQRTHFLSGLSAKGLGQDHRPKSTRIMVVSFAPGSADFIGNVIKVHGTMSAHAVSDSGGPALAIDVDYIFAYPIEPPGEPSDWMRFTARKYGSFDFAQWDDPGGSLEAYDQTVLGTVGAQCYTTDGYDHPDYPRLRTPDPRQSGQPVNAYSPGTANPGGNPVCGNSGGT